MWRDVVDDVGLNDEFALLAELAKRL